MDRPTYEHVLGNGCWPTQERFERPDHAPPVPQTLVSVPATLTRLAGSQPVLVTGPQPHVAEHMSINNFLFERVGRAQNPQQLDKYTWLQHPSGVIAGITSPATSPGQAELMCDTSGISRGLPALTNGHVHAYTYAQGVQCQQRWPCIRGYGGQEHTKRNYLPHPQSEKDFLTQQYARLSLADTAGADQKSPTPVATAPSTAFVATTPIHEAPAAAQQQQPQVVTETTRSSTGTAAAGTTGLTITTTTTTTTTTGATATTRTITGPDGTVLVPPPISAHPGCELSPQMAAALQEYTAEHICDYIQAKNLLKDKIVKKVLGNTQGKLMELLQKELERMSSEEEEEDDDVDLLDSDMEDGETVRCQKGEDWTFAG